MIQLTNGGMEDICKDGAGYDDTLTLQVIDIKDVKNDTAFGLSTQSFYLSDGVYKMHCALLKEAYGQQPVSLNIFTDNLRLQDYKLRNLDIIVL